MAVSTPIFVLRLLHVLGAMVVVGYYALLPLWKASATRAAPAPTPAVHPEATAASAADPRALRAFLTTERALELRLVLPALLVVLLTGLALVVGPYAMVRLAVSRWPQASIALGVILAILLVVGLGGPTKKMLALVDAGEPSGPAMDKLWGEWGTALAAGALLALVATGMMVYQASL